MFKRVLLLVCLVTVLVVPGAAYVDFRDDFSDGADGSWIHYTQGSFRSEIDGVLTFGTVSGSLAQRWNHYIYPVAMSPPFVVRYKVDTTNEVFYSGGTHFGFVSSTENPRYSGWSAHFPGGDFNQRVPVGSGVLEYDVDASGHVIVRYDGNQIRTFDVSSSGEYYGVMSVVAWDTRRYGISVDYAEIDPAPAAVEGEPCIIRIEDAETGLPLSGAWHLNILDGRGEGMLVDTDVSGNSKVVNLPQTSILKGHWLHITKDGYNQVPAQVIFDVPYGGRELVIRLTPLEAAPPSGSRSITFTCVDADTGSPQSEAMVNLDGTAKFVGVDGVAWFVVPENSTHKWVASTSSHWPMGGNITVTDENVTVLVELVRKTSELPRPPLPELPNLPVIHPSLDSAGFRMQILSVPYLGGMAEPLLDTVDNVAAGVNDIAFAVLGVLTEPADSVVLAVQGISSQLVDVSEAYLDSGVFVLDSLGMLIAVIPTKVINLVTFGMILDIIMLLLRGGL